MSSALIHTLTDPEFDELNDIVVNGLEPDAQWRHDYSGRGMFGARCLGLVLPRGVAPAAFMFRFGQALGSLDEGAPLSDDLKQALLNAHMDNMGRGSVIYWPQVRTDDGTPQPGVPVDL